MDNRITEEEVLDAVTNKISVFLEKFRAATTPEEKTHLEEEFKNSPIVWNSNIGPINIDFAVNDQLEMPAKISVGKNEGLRDIQEFLDLQKKIRIWSLQDAYWYAAESKETAIACYRMEQDLDPEVEVEAILVPDGDLEILKFEDEDGNLVSFRKYLSYLMFIGAEFPCAIAFNE